MLGPFATASRLTPIHQVSLAVLSRAACASMSTTTTTTTRDRGTAMAPWNGPNKVKNAVILEDCWRGAHLFLLSR